LQSLRFVGADVFFWRNTRNYFVQFPVSTFHMGLQIKVEVQISRVNPCACGHQNKPIYTWWFWLLGVREQVIQLLIYVNDYIIMMLKIVLPYTICDVNLECTKTKNYSYWNHFKKELSHFSCYLIILSIKFWKLNGNLNYVWHISISFNFPKLE